MWLLFGNCLNYFRFDFISVGGLIMAETCQGCQVTSDVEHFNLCEDCADKAASYDITLRDRGVLYRTACDALDDLENLKISSAIGRLKYAKEYCKPTKSQETKSK